MAIIIDPKVAAYYDVTFILCAMVSCSDCHREIEYTSTHQPFTDANYYDAAVAMQVAGWALVPRTYETRCPTCAAKRLG